jgi:hypothetical protein
MNAKTIAKISLSDHQMVVVERKEGMYLYQSIDTSANVTSPSMWMTRIQVHEFLMHFNNGPEMLGRDVNLDDLMDLGFNKKKAAEWLEHLTKTPLAETPQLQEMETEVQLM